MFSSTIRESHAFNLGVHRTTSGLAMPHSLFLFPLHFSQYVHVFRLPVSPTSLAGDLASCKSYYFSKVSCRMLHAWENKIESAKKL